jgi:uncharacterized protein YneF (UPF0154 family)
MVNCGEKNMIEALFLFLIVLLGVFVIVGAFVCFMFVMTRIDENE